MFAVFASMLSKVYDPVFADIDFAVDIDKRRAHLKVAGYIDQRGEPIVNPITGGEHRISNFLLWQLAYAELYFTERLWPDFTARDLDDALSFFASRERRFGQRPAAVSSAR